MGLFCGTIVKGVTQVYARIKTRRPVQQNKMSFTVYKLKTKRQTNQKTGGRLWSYFIGSEVQLLTGCVTFGESLNLSLSQFPNL